MMTAGAVAGVVGVAAASAANVAAKEAAELIAKEAVAAGYFVIKNVSQCIHNKCSAKPLCKHPREIHGWLQPGAQQEPSTLFITRIDKQQEKVVSERLTNSTHLKSLAGCEFIYLDGSGELKKIQFVTDQQFKKFLSSQIASAAAAKQHKKSHTHRSHSKLQTVDVEKEKNRVPAPPATEEKVQESSDLVAKPTTEEKEPTVSTVSPEKSDEKRVESAPQPVAVEAPVLPEAGIFKRFVSFWLLFGWLFWLVNLIRPAKSAGTV